MSDSLENLCEKLSSWGFTRSKSEITDVDPEQEEYLQSLYTLQCVVAEVMYKTINMLWNEVTPDHIQDTKDVVMQYETDILKIQSLVKNFQSTADMAKKVTLFSQQLELVELAYESHMLPEHWISFFSESDYNGANDIIENLKSTQSETSPVISFIIKDFFASLTTTYVIDHLRSTVMKSRREEELLFQLTDFRNRFTSVLLPIDTSSGNLVLLNASQFITIMLELRTSLLLIAPLSESDSDRIQSENIEIGEAITRVRSLIVIWIELTMNLTTMESVLNNPSVRERMADESNNVIESKNKLKSIKKLIISIQDGCNEKNITISSLHKNPSDYACIERCVDEATELVRQAKNDLSECVVDLCHSFPKLNWLEEDMLLNVIAVKSIPDEINKILPLIYDSITSLIIKSTTDNDLLHITGVTTAAEEVLKFPEELIVNISEDSYFSEWIVQLQQSIDMSISSLTVKMISLSEGLRVGRNQLTDRYLESLPGHFCTLGVHLTWTGMVEASLGVPSHSRGESTLCRDKVKYSKPGLSSSVRPSSAACPVTSTRPMSAKYATATRRPQTAELRLKNLTTPLAADSSIIRPGSAGYKAAKHPTAKADETRAARPPRRRSSARKKGEEAADRPGTSQKRRSIMRKPDSRPGSSALGLRGTAVTHTNVESFGLGRAFQEDFDRSLSPPVRVPREPSPPPVTVPVPVGAGFDVGRCRWVTSPGLSHACQKLRSMLGNLVDMSLGNIPRRKRIKIEGLINLLKYLTDAAEDDSIKKTESLTDFDWQRLPRIYAPRSHTENHRPEVLSLDEGNHMVSVKGGTPVVTGHVFKMGSLSLPSGMEFHASHTTPVIVTPQTVKYWLHLVQAIALHYSGIISSGTRGIAVQAIKDLSSMAGRFVVVLEGNSEVTSSQLSSFFIGLVETGSWGIVDGVNKIPSELMSNLNILTERLHSSSCRPAIAMGGGLRQGVPGAAIFGLLSPSSTNHVPALPSDLQAQYRVLSLPIPNYSIICSTLLTIAGFDQDTISLLSRRLESFIQLLNNSFDDKYNFGIHTLRTISRRASELLRKQCSSRERRHVLQDLLLLRSCREVVTCQLEIKDHASLLTILSDIFPGQKTCCRHLLVTEALRTSLSTHGITSSPGSAWENKVSLLYETYVSASNILLLGNGYTGKTTARKVLFEVLNIVTCCKQTEVVLYPNSHPAGDYFGRIGQNMIWEEGIFSRELRHISDSSNPTWIVLDGKLNFLNEIKSLVDAVPQINKPHQSRVRLGSNCKIVLETDVIPSSATVDVLTEFTTHFFDDDIVEWKNLLLTKLSSISNTAEHPQLSCFYNLCEQHLPSILSHEVVMMTDIHVVSTLHAVGSLFSCAKAIFCNSRMLSNDSRANQTTISPGTHSVFWWCVAHVLVAGATDSARSVFERQVIEPQITAAGLSLPSGVTSIFDVVLDDKSCTFSIPQPLTSLKYSSLASSGVPPSLAAFEIVTAISPGASWLTQLLIQTPHSVVVHSDNLVTGKTVLSKCVLQSLGKSYLTVRFGHSNSPDRNLIVSYTGAVLIDDVSLEPESTFPNPFYEMINNNESLRYIATVRRNASNSSYDRRFLSKFVQVHCNPSYSSTTDSYCKLLRAYLKGQGDLPDFLPSMTVSVMKRLRVVEEPTCAVVCLPTFVKIMTFVSNCISNATPRCLMSLWKSEIALQLNTTNENVSNACTEVLRSVVPTQTMTPDEHWVYAKPGVESSQNVVVDIEGDGYTEKCKQLLSKIHKTEYILYPSLMRTICLVSRIISVVNSHALVIGIPGSGRGMSIKVAAAVSDIQSAEVFIDQSSISIPINIINKVSECHHCCLIVRVTSESKFNNRVSRQLSEICSGNVSVTEDQKENLIASHHDAIISNISSIFPELTSATEKWQVIQKAISLYLHVFVVTEKDSPTISDFCSRENCSKFSTSSNLTESDFRSISAIKGIDASNQNAVTKLLHDTHKWVEEKMSIPLPPSYAPRAITSVMGIASSREITLKKQIGMMQGSQRDLLSVSHSLSTSTGVPPKPISCDASHSVYFTAQVTDSLLIKVVLDIIDNDPSLIRNPGVCILNTSNNEPIVNFFVQGEIDYNNSPIEERNGGPPTSSRLSITGSSISLEDCILTKTIVDNVIIWRIVGVLKTTGNNDVPFTLSQSTPVDESSSWLRGQMKGGARVEPTEIQNSVQVENLDSITRHVHEILETERSRISDRLAYLSPDTLISDAVVAGIFMTYSPGLLCDHRIGLFNFIIDSCKPDSLNLKIGKSLTPKGLYAVYQSCDDTEVYCQLSSAVRSKLPPGFAWESLCVAALSSGLIRNGNQIIKKEFRIPFVIDPHNVFLPWLAVSEETLRAGNTSDLLCIHADDPTIDTAFIDSIKQGKTLIIENIDLESHVEKITHLSSIRFDSAAVQCHCSLPGFPQAMSYSEDFRMILVSSSESVSDNDILITEIHARCSVLNATLGSEGVADAIQNSMVHNDQGLSGMLEKVSKESDVSYKKLLVNETPPDDDNNSVLLYGDPSSLLERLYGQELQSCYQRMSLCQSDFEKCYSKVRNIEQQINSSMEQFVAIVPKLMAVYEASCDAAVVYKSPTMKLRVNRILKLVARQQNGPRSPGDKGKQELVESIISSITFAAFSSTDADYRMLLATLMAVNSERLSSEISPCDIQKFITADRGNNIHDHLLQEENIKSKIESQYKNALSEYNKKQASAQKENNEQQDGARPTSGKQKQGVKSVKKTAAAEIPIPVKQPFPNSVKPDYKWLDHSRWVEVLRIASEIPIFSKIPEFICPEVVQGGGKQHRDQSKAPRTQAATRDLRWQEWFDGLGKLPDMEKITTSKFDKLLLNLAVRPDKSMNTIRKYIIDINKNFDPYALTSPLSPDIITSSSHDTAITFILGSGDSNCECLQLAKSIALTTKSSLPDASCISMQHGSEEGSLQAVRQGLITGSWVYIANVHCTDKHFHRDLVVCMRECTTPNSNFRLFLTYRDTQREPPQVVAESVLVAVGGARGVKNSMSSIYKNIESQSLASWSASEWQRLLFCVLLVVVLVGERDSLVNGMGKSVGTHQSLAAAASAVSALKQQYSSQRLSYKHKDSRISEACWGSLRHSLTEAMSMSCQTSSSRLSVKAFIDWWIHPEITSRPGMIICKGFQIPLSDLSSHLQAIDLMPSTDTTELLGLHPSSETIAQRCLLEGLRSSMSQIFFPLNNKLTPDVLSYRDGKIKQFLSKLPGPFTRQEMSSFCESGSSPYSEFFASELRKLNSLLIQISESVSGEISKQEINNQISNGTVPTSWPHWFDTTNTGSWLSCLLAAKKQIYVFCKNPKLATQRPIEIGLFKDPMNLIIAHRRAVCRKLKWGYASVECQALLLNDSEDCVVPSLVLSRLKSVGFMWNSESQLVTDIPSSNWWHSYIKKFPSLRIIVTPTTISRQPTGIPVPLFCRASDQEPLLSVILPSEQTEPNHWVLRDAKILCGHPERV